MPARISALDRSSVGRKSLRNPPPEPDDDRTRRGRGLGVSASSSGLGEGTTVGSDELNVGWVG